MDHGASPVVLTSAEAAMAEYEGRRATAVFAVPLRHYRPEDIRGALVDETAESTLLVLAGG
ncbi:hypothetical protein [Actinoallomurus acanthiterrae]